MTTVLKPFKEEQIITTKKANYTIFDERLVEDSSEKDVKKYTASGIIKKDTVIDCALYHTEGQYVAVLVLYAKGQKPSLRLEIKENEDSLFSQQGKRVMTKELITESAEFHIQLVNDYLEKFVTGSDGPYGVQYSSNETKLIQLFVSDDMMSQDTFTDKIRGLLREG